MKSGSKGLRWTRTAAVWSAASLWCVCGGMLIASLAARWNDAWEPCSNLRWWWALGVGLGSAGWAWRCWASPRRQRGRRVLLTAASALSLLGLLPGLRLYLPVSESEPGGAAELRVGSVNLRFGIAHPRPVRAWMAAENLDVVGMVELKSSLRSKLRWPQLLASWSQEYPHQFIAEHDYYGMAILSKHPLLEREVEYSDASLGAEFHRPIALQASLTWEGQPLRLILIHPPRPEASWRLGVRKEFLESLATRVGAASSCVVFGDFNTTEGSPFFQELLARTGLTDSREGRGLLPTWTPHWFWLPLVPLDHILVRGPRVLSRGVGPSVRSDHRPVHATLAWPNPSKSRPSHD